MKTITLVRVALLGMMFSLGTALYGNETCSTCGRQLNNKQLSGISMKQFDATWGTGK